jgi:glycosyltransferase involved in cell wall biosynthesis
VDAVTHASRVRKIAGVIAGSGPLESQLHERIAAFDAPVKMIGFVNQSALPALYAATQMLVLPSDASETWGLVVNEAMACGVPAVVSDAAGCARDLIDSSTGCTYPVGNVTALSAAMCQLGDRLRQAPQETRDALTATTAVFSAASAAERTLAAIENVLSAVSAKPDGKPVGRTVVAE